MADAVQIVALPTTPKEVVVSRASEKKNLQNLNEKLGEYIGKVSFLTEDNRRLRHDLEALNAAFVQLDSALKEKYEEEIKGLRAALDKASVEKTAAIKRGDRFEEDWKKSDHLLDAESREHERTKRRIPDLEKMVIERDGTIEILTKNVTLLQEEMKLLKSKTNEMKIEMTKSYQDADEVAVMQIQFESQLQTKDEEIDFMKKMYEEQLEILSQIEINVNTESCCPKHLVDTLKDIRADYEAMARPKDGDPDVWYKSKFEQIMKIGDQKREALTEEKKKVEDFRQKYEHIKDDYDILVKLMEEERKKTKRAEDNLTETLADHAEEVVEKDGAIDELKAELAQLFELLRRLADPNLGVEEEINVTKKLVENREKEREIMNNRNASSSRFL